MSWNRQVTNGGLASSPRWDRSPVPVSLVLTSLLAMVLSADSAQAQPGWVLSHQKISDTEGDFGGVLDDLDYFGNSLAYLGDLDGDGVGDLAVGAYYDDDGAHGAGAVWVLFLNTDGTVKSYQKISSTEGNFSGRLDSYDYFGRAVASLGDLDGDGVGDLAVSATFDDDGGPQHGAVWILFLNTNGTVRSQQKISSTEGAFTGTLDHSDVFGTSIVLLGDLDGDGIGDLAVGAMRDDDGGTDRGAMWVLFLNADGTVKSHQKISQTQGGFTGKLRDTDMFGQAATSLGDLDGDGVGDLVVGALGDDDAGTNRGAIWILLLNTDGTVKSHQKVSDTEGGFTGQLNDYDYFSVSMASPGDLDGDNVSDLAVGSWRDDDGGDEELDYGAVWILFLNTNGTVKSHQKINASEGGFTGQLNEGDFFGKALTPLGDFNGDGINDLAVGAPWDDDGGEARGAVWTLFLDGVLACPWDLDGSGSVGASDLLALLVSWGPCKGCPADFNGDGNVGASDLLALLANWGPCP
ncbi:MAG: integrin alpha [Phycisphaerales bacterium]